jgi:hypothetical protein
MITTWLKKGLNGLKSEKKTYPHEADKLFVTNSFIGFVIGRRAFRSRAVAKGGITTAVVVTTLDTVSQLARFRAARALCSNNSYWFDV